MSFVQISRIPLNTQVVDLKPTHIISHIPGLDEDGEEVTCTFLDPAGKVGDLVIPAGSVGLMLDTDNPQHLHNLINFRNALRVTPEPGGDRFRVTDFQQVASMNLAFKRKRARVQARVSDLADNPAIVLSIARRLGATNVEKLKPEETLDYVMSVCEDEKGADRVEQLLDSEDQQTLLLLSDSVAHGWVSVDGDEYFYGKKPMGRGERNALYFLAENPDIAMELNRRLSRKMLGGPATRTAPAAGSPAPAPSTGANALLNTQVDDDDDEDGETEEELRARLEAQKAEAKRRDEINKLVDKALNQKAMVMGKDEEGNACYMLGDIALSAPLFGPDARNQAVACLTKEGNANLVKLLKKALQGR